MVFLFEYSIGISNWTYSKTSSWYFFIYIVIIQYTAQPNPCVNICFTFRIYTESNHLSPHSLPPPLPKLSFHLDFSSSFLIGLCTFGFNVFHCNIHITSFHHTITKIIFLRLANHITLLLKTPQIHPSILWVKFHDPSSATCLLTLNFLNSFPTILSHWLHSFLPQQLLFYSTHTWHMLLP